MKNQAQMISSAAGKGMDGMDRLGVSSACFYPLETESSIEKMIGWQIPLCEIFFNAPSELAPAFVASLKAQTERGGLRVVSIHPFTAFTESFFLFSSYRRRYEDTIPFYRTYFETAAALGAEIVVIHGLKAPCSITDEEYFERFAHLMEIGSAYGVRVCQENVVRYRSEDPAFLRRMANAIGSDFGVVLDIKQARRAGVDYREFLDAVGGQICHVHLSDFDETRDCIPPGEGLFDFRRFFADLRALNYGGAYVVELYGNSYTNEEQIRKSYEYLRKCLP